MLSEIWICRFRFTKFQNTECDFKFNFQYLVIIIHGCNLGEHCCEKCTLQLYHLLLWWSVLHKCLECNNFVFFKTDKLRIIDISPIKRSCAMLCLIYNRDGKVKITSKCTFFTFITRCLFPGALCKLWRPWWSSWCLLALFTWSYVYDCFRGKVWVC